MIKGGLAFSGREIVKQGQQSLVIFSQDNFYISRLVRVGHKNLQFK